MKLFTALPFAAALMLSATSALAASTIITFDDLPSNSLTLISSYAGFEWNNFYVFDGKYSHGGTGFDLGTVTAPNVAFNGYGEAASFSSATAFTLETIAVTMGWIAGVTHFDGYVGTTLTYSLDVYSTTTSPTLATFNWVNLNKVTISSFDNSYITVIDNVTVSAVPEPATYGMLLAGLGLVGAVSRRRARQV